MAISRKQLPKGLMDMFQNGRLLATDENVEKHKHLIHCCWKTQ